MNVETPVLPSPAQSAPRICQTQGHRVAGLSCYPLPQLSLLPQSQQEGVFGFFVGFFFAADFSET